MSANWANQTIWTGDNLPIMRGMNSASVDLIYLDPPFNSKTDYAAPIGSKAAGAEFKDTWTLKDVDIAWLDLIEAKHPNLNKVIHAAMSKSNKSYLIYMAVRLLEMKRVLKETGSIYLHCDQTMSHYLKLAMDSIFGRKNFRNEIIWRRVTSDQKGSQHRRKSWGTNTDTLLFYTLGKNSSLNGTRPLTDKEAEAKFNKKDPESGRRYYLDNNHIWSTPNMGERPNLCYEWRGFKNKHSSGWRLSRERLEEEYQKGNIVIREDGKLERRKYEDDYEGVPIGNLWTDIEPVKGKEATDYPTQKPLELLQRIIRASCPEDGIVLDPFCGCATTLIAAQIEHRQWAGIDLSPKAAELVKIRMKKEVDLFYQGTIREDIPRRTDIQPLRKHNHPDNKKQLYGEQGGHCNGCKEHFQKQHLTIDHIIAQSKGGTDHLGNLQLLCNHCNSVKGDRGQEYLISKLAA